MFFCDKNAIIDKKVNLVVKYNYTTYGTITSISGSLAGTIGAYNPFRYKGYYYDTETKMYYCKSRYYVPEWCRWLNGDHVGYLNPEDIDGMNLFTYCGNNPVMLVDEEGASAIFLGFAIAIGLMALIATITLATMPDVTEDVVRAIGNGINAVGGFVENVISEAVTMASIPFVFTFVALDNVFMSKKSGNLKDTGAPSDIPNEKDLRDKYKDARKRGDQKEAARIKLQQKVLGYRNKQKRNGKKPKGDKSRNIILALLIHEILRRF